LNPPHKHRHTHTHLGAVECVCYWIAFHFGQAKGEGGWRRVKSRHCPGNLAKYFLVALKSWPLFVTLVYVISLPAPTYRSTLPALPCFYS